MKRVVLNEKKNEYLRVMSTNVAGLRGLIKNEERIKKFLTVCEGLLTSMPFTYDKRGGYSVMLAAESVFKASSVSAWL